ncbi:iron-siderophore ABC transporter substrate-binding protein [Rhodococcoides fascians]|uniref:iron-siderophore ABC transporter substrate-binding protein n=1 Tax=Rhodococcoides fascians TaxID=1828 RepID=UPI000A77717A|nr:iron-siderophore ABC transporter substrate-binding protein [Rhodococcus fascians]
MRIRRTVGAVSVAMLFLTAVVSCGSGGDDGPGSEAPSDGSAAAFPVTIDTEFGDVTVDSAPQRVVALGWGDAETALALGVSPVGASDWLAFGGDGVGPWAAGLYDAPPQIIGTQEPSFEQVAALEPDLILDTKSSGDADRYATLSAIAPTVGIPAGADNYLTTLEQQVTMVATALGKQSEGDALLAGIADRFDAAASAHPEFAGKTAVVGAYSGTGYGAYISSNSRLEFMKKLGFVTSPAIDSLPPRGFSVPISGEELDLLDADVLIVFPIQKAPSEVTDNPLFQRIPAVADGRYVVFDDPEVAKSYATNSALSIGYALDTVVPAVANVLG